jgi:integrase
VALQRQLPPNLSKQRGLLDASGGDLSAVAALAAKRGLASQNDRTVNKKMGIVDQCFRWIGNHYDECGPSPVAGMKLRIRQNAKEEREPFTCNQLNAIFHAPVYTGCRSEARWGTRGSLILRDSAKYWIPLIALFSGMRLNEICQLTRNHIREHNGISYFCFDSRFAFEAPG